MTCKKMTVSKIHHVETRIFSTQTTNVRRNVRQTSGVGQAFHLLARPNAKIASGNRVLYLPYPVSVLQTRISARCGRASFGGTSFRLLRLFSPFNPHHGASSDRNWARKQMETFDQTHPKMLIIVLRTHVRSLVKKFHRLDA